MEHSFREFIETLGKKGGFEILLLLKNSPKRWSYIENTIKDKRAMSYRIRELLKLGLIKVTIIYDTPTGTKAYELTPLGKKIVQLIEEMEKEFEKWHSGLPKEPDKFIEEVLEGD
jgi:DNA-binding HxlR family transcriptional regulator